MSEEGNYELGGKCPTCGMYAIDTFETITINEEDYDNCTFCGYLKAQTLEVEAPIQAEANERQLNFL
ncbi:MAG: hypothetical protein ACXAC8_17605 [Candidatus Hodarchaeales archaeon]|jgi:Zn ribbon nucleic-acid-binding protein